MDEWIDWDGWINNNNNNNDNDMCYYREFVQNICMVKVGLPELFHNGERDHLKSYKNYFVSQ